MSERGARRALTWGSARIGGGAPAVVVPLTGPTTGDAAEQARRAAAAGADALELRVDLLDEVRRALEGAAPPPGEGPEPLAGAAGRALEGLARCGGAGPPVLLTCRTAAEGGGARVGEAAYRALLLAILEGLGAWAGPTRPAAIDVEVRRGCLPELAARAHARGIDVVGSFHDLGGTPADAELEAVLVRMAAQGADLAKVAVMPQSAEDVARLLGVGARMSAGLEVPVAVISMGALGAVSRVAPVFGSALTFAVVPDGRGEARASAPGQLPIDEVRRCLGLLGG
ncbi:type I 3-dehydroquinate dehydratase [Actinomyces bowdenii]|uniref:3-dehydroquinate dehydratase n=1 Tax=Actinomyces bowdenii TaxID=131109 RepID=A0A3P1V507_9ACTO|nr:type I 3-dehydroquinate dehydratase [Actinomyces bowdenii]RRD29314.1 type I 3-dehydroquinate dehydratase [Actinomyces bowdenii]